MGDLVTVCIPHRDTHELLRSVIPLWRSQTIPVFVVVIDTGSKNLPYSQLKSWKICGRNAIDILDVIPERERVHFGDAVAAANQFAQDLCFTSRILFTHSDVFPKRRDLIESLLGFDLCGYRMSPRDHCNGYLKKSWRNMIGHSLMLCRSDFLRTENASWSRMVAENEFGLRETSNPDNWDSEVTMNLFFQRAGVRPHILGDELNFQRFEDDRIVHCRSATLAKMDYLPQDRKSVIEHWLEKEIKDASLRIFEWDKLSKVGLFVPLSGREWIWPRFSRMLDLIDWPRDQIKLVFLDTSRNESFSKMVSSWIENCSYKSVAHHRVNIGRFGLSDMRRQDHASEVQEVMPKIYGWMRDNIRTKFILNIEDDVIPPDGSFLKKLMSHMSEGVFSCSAVYCQKDNHSIPFAWNWNGRGFEFSGKQKGVTSIGGNGFGCVLLKGSAVESFGFSPGEYPDIDVQFYSEARKGHEIALIDWDIECEHASE